MEMPRRLNPAAIKAARERAGRSKNETAAAIGMSFPGYTKWESGKGKTAFDWNRFVQLCDFLSVRAEALTLPFTRPPSKDRYDP